MFDVATLANAWIFVSETEYPPFGNGSYKHRDSHYFTDNRTLSSQALS